MVKWEEDYKKWLKGKMINGVSREDHAKSCGYDLGALEWAFQAGCASGQKVTEREFANGL